MKNLNRFGVVALFIVIIASLTILMAGCGGGGGDGGFIPETPETPQTQTGDKISGVASKGLIRNGAVAAYAIDDQGQRVLPALASGTTGSDGGYSLVVDHSGPVLIEVTSGTYTDEATQREIQISSPLRAALSSMDGDVQMAVTPLTEIAVRMAETGGGLFPGKIDAANALVSQLLGQDADVLSTQPSDTTDQDAFTAAPAAEQNYGLLLAGFSKMAETGGQSAMDIVKAIEEDLADLRIDRTGSSLVASIATFVAADDTDLDDILTNNMTAGMKPTGTLPEAKELLSKFMNSPSQDSYDALMAYLDTFTPESKESYLLEAFASLMNVYGSSAAQFITSDSDGWNLGVDPETFDQNRFASKLLSSATLSGDVKGLLEAITDQLSATYGALEKAEGVNTMLTLNGMDTVYIDDIDVKIFKSITKSLQTLFFIPQAVELTVHDWNVTDGMGGTIDARDLIVGGPGLSEAQNADMLAGNPDLFNYSDASKLADVKAALSQAAADLSAAVSALDAMGEQGRKKRFRNAFNIDSDLQFQLMKAASERTLPSMLAAMDDPAAVITTVKDVEVGSRPVTGEDGYTYIQTEHDLYLRPHQPSGTTLTIYDLMSGTKSFRDLLEESKAAGEDYDFYPEGTLIPYMQGVFNIDWQSPF